MVGYVQSMCNVGPLMWPSPLLNIYIYIFVLFTALMAFAM